jgi:hypothetical protein
VANINLVVRKPDGKITSVTVSSNNLSDFITNVKLYEKNLQFVDDFLSDKDQCEIYPQLDGIIVVDMQDDIILDSQGVTGVNKLTPAEIKMSKNGNRIGETKETSIIGRFKALVESGRLKGFEEWYDNGTGLNTNVLKMDYETLLETTLETNVYGQFVFNTKPFKLEIYCETDQLEQSKMFHTLVNHGFLQEDSPRWKEFLKGLK